MGNWMNFYTLQLHNWLALK